MIINLNNNRQGDWNQNNATASDYIKNRPFYTTDPVETVVYENDSLELTDLSSNFGRPIGLAEFAASLNGYTFTCVINGVSYEAERKNYNGYDYLGNISLHPSLSGEDTGEPYLMLISSEGVSFLTNIATSGTISLTIIAASFEVIKIPLKYLPDEVYDGIRIANIADMTDELAKYYHYSFNNNKPLFYYGNKDELSNLVLYFEYLYNTLRMVYIDNYYIHIYEGGIGGPLTSDSQKDIYFGDLIDTVQYAVSCKNVQDFSLTYREQGRNNIGIIVSEHKPSGDRYDIWCDTSGEKPVLKYRNSNNEWKVIESADLLKYTAQSLDDNQKSQARLNIDAAASEHSHNSSDVGIYVQDSEPTNALQNELWIDTSTEILNAEGVSF